MSRPDVSVATMTLARDDAEATELQHALDELQRHGVAIFVTDGGSCQSFLDRIASASAFTVRASQFGPGLVGQVKTSIAAALDAGAERVLYTEPDKAWFFAHRLSGLIERASSGGLVLASRSDR